MTSLTYPSGTTANLVAGGVANMVDITGPLSDFSTFINGSNLDSTTNLAAGTFAPYTTIARSCGTSPVLVAANTFYFAQSFSYVSGAGASANVPLIPFNPADYTLDGRTLKLRLEVISYVSGSLPSVTFTWGLYPVTVAGAADNLTPTLGTVTSGSTVARVNPNGSNIYRDVGSDFNGPTAGTYILGFTTTASLASNKVVQSDIRLQARWV